MPGQFTGQRGLAQGFIDGMIKDGLTNEQIVKNLTLAGISYRMQNMYSDVNRIRLEKFGSEGIKGLDMQTPVPTNLMREWEGNTDFKFRVVVQYDYTPTGSNDVTQGASTLYYDRPPTVNDVLEDWGVRVKTLEGNFAGYDHISRIEGIAEINYFYNTPKRT
jgi:Uncharacterized conserved protein